MNMVTRQEWGAAPPRGPVGGIRGAVSKLFLHHTDTDSGPPENEHQLARHVQEVGFGKGFSDISYSFLVFPTGHIFEGRGWGKEGAHTLGHNSTSYAISLVGNYEREPMTDAQVEAAREIIGEGQSRGFIVRDPSIQGHRDVFATACPGANAFARLDELRKPISGQPGGSTGTPHFPGAILRRGSRGSDVCTVQERLRVLGHNIDRIAGCPFGPQTRAAVTAFQAQRGLVADGEVGPNTWQALFS